MNDISFQDAASENAVNGLITQTLLKLDKTTNDDKGVNYKPLYYFLFNGISTVLDRREMVYRSIDPTIAEFMDMLIKLQRDAEDLFLKQGEK